MNKTTEYIKTMQETASESKLISLSQGKFTIVDEADYEWLMQWKWWVNGKYAQRRVTIGKPLIKGCYNQKSIRMHRLIIAAPDDMQVDHINGNSLDNRKCNLRPCTPMQNSRNIRKYKGITSSYKGVHKTQTEKWIAQIKLERVTSLGTFYTELEAAFAYNQAAKRHFGEFAYLNDIGDFNPPKKITNKSSPYRGAIWNKQANSWKSEITIAGVCIYLGSFHSDVEAARAYNTAALAYRKNPTFLNEIHTS